MGQRAEGRGLLLGSQMPSIYPELFGRWQQTLIPNDKCRNRIYWEDVSKIGGEGHSRAGRKASPPGREWVAAEIGGGAPWASGWTTVSPSLLRSQMLRRQRPAGFSLEGREWRLAGPSKTSHSGAAVAPNRRGLQFPEVEGAGVGCRNNGSPRCEAPVCKLSQECPHGAPKMQLRPWSGSRHHWALEALA